MAERRGRVITVYVAPGLTAAGRNAALRRLRLSGRRGYGPRLPAVPLAFARFADRIRTTVARAGSVFRTHPAGATGPVMLMSAGASAPVSAPAPGPTPPPAAPTVSASGPVSVSASAPVSVSVSAAAAVSASLPVPGSAAAGSFTGRR